jgi:hypothetical protein
MKPMAVFGLGDWSNELLMSRYVDREVCVL